MANNTRKKNTREQAEHSFTNIDSSSASTTLRKMSLSALATVLTAATCLGGQPILASSNILLPPTTAAFAAEVHKNDPTPWLHKPNILEFQRYRFANSNGTTGSTAGLGDYDNTTKKSDMYAHLEKDGNDKYLIFDVFFNNDGKSMLTHSNQHQYVWQIPFTVADLNSNGGYKNDTISELSFDFYQRNDVSPQTANAMLSRDIKLFRKDDKKSFSVNVGNNGKDNFGSTYLNTLGIRGGGSYNRDLNETFHNNAKSSGKVDPVIEKAVKLYGPYSGKSYGIGLRTTNANYAVHMHCKLKLRQDATIDDIQNAFTWANSSSYGKTTNSAYTFISGRTHDENFPRTKSDNLPPKLYFNGKELTDNSSSITVYQGDKQKITFGTSDNSEKVTSFSVKGFPDSIKSANFDGNNKDGYDATEKNPYKHEIKDVKFEHKDGKTPVNSDYTITVSATDASGNKAEKKVTVHLKNLNQKYKEPTTTPITVDWGHKPDADELKKHVSGADGGTLTFDSIPETKIPEQYFNGKDTLPAHASGKVTYSDGSYHNVTVPVNVRKPLSLQHKLNGNTVNATVGDPLTKAGNKVDAKKYLGLTDTELNNKKIKSAEWVNGEPSTAVAGKRTYTAKVTFSDDSTAEEKVTFTVRPQKPEIETDLTGVAGVKNKEVVVKAGPGTEGSTVTLKDNGKKVIGTGKVGADGKVTIKVAGGIPEGNITAVTTTADSVSSDESEPKNVSKDNAAPTLTGPDSVTVKVGEDLKIQLTAKDNVKIESIDTATATTAFSDGTDFNKILQNMSRAKTDYTTNTDKEKVFTYSFSGFKPEEVGTYNLTFSATDAAGHKTEKTVTVKVEKKENLQSKNITVDLHHKLDEGDAKKAIANSRKLPKKTKFAWAQDGKPDTSTVGKEKEGTVIVTIPTNDPKKPQVETVKVKVTVKDRKEPEVKIQQKVDGGTYNTIDAGHPDGPKHPPVFTINTYRGDKNDIKITATDNSGEVTTLTLTPKTPGEKEKDPTGTGTTDAPKTLMLDDITPLNTKPGDYKRTITAVDPSGNTTTVAVKFVVKTQAEKYSKVTGTPVTYKMSDGTKHPKPEDGIAQESKNKLPKDAKYSWVNEPDWNKPVEQKDAEVLITFPDGSTEKVDTKVTVKDDIAPVIENPATNKAKKTTSATETPEYYQFKVHNGKQFSIDINAYDNSGKIKKAEFDSALTTAIPDSKISITNNDKNSAEKPAKITITGTAQRDPKITNSSDNKWSRELVVTDEAGNTSKLKVQISVYTDAEEHNATAKQVDNPKDTNAITDAITITKYDNTNKPIDKKGITFEVVGNIPTENGNYTIPVTIHYPDKSTEKVEVPVKIRKDSNDFEPEGKTIEVSWHSSTEELKKKVTSFGDNNGLKWKSTAKPDEKNKPTVTIVGDKSVPSTDKPGESKVQVNVKYSDGSSDVATVTIKVLDPQSETYTPEGQTINVAYSKTPNKTIENSIRTNGIKLKKNGTETPLPTDATVTIDNNDTIPDGTQPGDFNIPVTITYKDGSKSHATVKVTVGKPQSETHTPKVDNSGITKKYGESGPSESEIIAKVTVPDKPTKGETTITVDQGQIPIDTKTPGTVNVKVTVTYPDGSEDHVEVPVTVGDPDNVTHKASATPIELHKNEAQPTEQQIKDKVTTGVSANEDQPTITVDTGKIPTTDKTGTTNVPVTITYKDKTSTTVQVPVIVKDWNKDEYPPSAEPVEEPYNTSKDTIKNDIINAVTVDWPDKNDKTKPQPKVTITSEDKDIPSGTEPGTKTVKVTVTYPDTSTKEVTVDVTIKNKQSDTFEPKVTPVVKPYDTKKDEIENAIKDAVKIPDFKSKEGEKKPEISIVTGDGNTVPDGQTPGSYTVKVKITYPDKTEKVVKVPVTISSKESDAYPPKADSITKKNGEKPSEDEIKNAVKIPNWPSDKGEVKKTVDSNSIPDGNKGGTFNVPVTVTYPDKSTTVINVPVIINAPKPVAKTGVTVPKGVEPKPEDMISNKDKFPEGTTFEWKKENGKPDTSKKGNGKSGIVVVTVPDQPSQEVPVTVNVVDPGTPQINVPQGTDLPKPGDVIKDSDKTNKYPDDTTFEWKPEDTPDTNNPGTKNGVIIVTIPGQKSVEVPVTVNVTPNPETNVVNVKVGGNLPDASNGIANKDKFPDGTKYTWKNNGPSTTTPDTTKGTVLIHIPGVKNPVEVEVPVNITPKPTAKETSVIQNSDPDPKNSIDNSKDLPKGTTFEWKKDAAPKTDKPGNTTGTVIVKIPGQDPQEVPVNITVTASPEGKDVTVLQKTGSKDTTPKPQEVIKNNSDLPKNAEVSWKKEPDTSKTGNQPGVVTVTVPGEPDVDIQVNVLVVPNPKDKTVNVPVGAKPKPEDSISNQGDLPQGTTFTWATGENGTPDTKTAGSKQGTVVVNIPGITNPVNVKVTVNVVDKDKPFINDGKAENTPTKPDKTTITGKGTPDATIKVQDSNGNALKDGNKEIAVTVGKDGSFTVDVPHQNPDTKLTLVPSNNGNEGTPVDVTVIAKPNAPTITVPSDNAGGKQGDGNVTVTPPTDDTVTTVEITVKPNPLNGPEQPVRTIVVKKGKDNKWTIDGNNPTGATVDNNGNVTIPAKNLEDGSTITAVAKNKNNTSDTATNKTGYKTPQIKNEDPSSPKITDSTSDSGKQTITGVVTVPNATVTVTDKDGKQIGTGTADKDGNFKITIDKQTPGTIITLTPTNGKGDGAKTGDRVELTVGGAIATPKISTPNDGSASVTPDLTDTRVNKVVITYTPDNSTETSTITVVAEGDKGEWKISGTAPEGVTVDSQTGKVTVPAGKIKNGSKITAQAENSADKSKNGKSEEVTDTVLRYTPHVDTAPNKPTVTTPSEGADQGSAIVTPPADVDTLLITFLPEGSSESATPVTITVKKDKNGNWTIDGTTPTGVTVDPKTGKVTIPATAVKGGSEVTAQAKKGDKQSDKATGTTARSEKKQPNKPEPEPTPIPTDKPLVVTPQDGEEQGSATVTPPADADSMEITYIPEGEKTSSGIGETEIPSLEELVPGTTNPDSQEPGNNPGNNPGNTQGNTPGNTPGNENPEGETSGNETPARVTIKIKKDAKGNWQIDGDAPDGVTVDPQTGKVTIPANKVKDNTEITAKSKKGNKPSKTATGTVGNNPIDDLNIDDLIDNAGGNNNEKGKGHGENHGNGNNDGNGNDNTGDAGNNYTGDAGNKGDTLNPESGTHRIKHGDTIDANGANNNRANGDDSGSTGNGAQGTQGSQGEQGAQGTQSGSQGAPSESQAKIDKIRARHSSGKIAKSKLSNTGAAIAAISTIAALAAAVGGAIAVIRKKKRK